MFISHNYAKIEISSDDDLPLEETLTLCNVIILINSVLNEIQKHCHCNIFLEKCLYQLAKKYWQKSFW